MFKKVVSAIMVAAMVGTMVAPVSVSAKDGGNTIELWTCWTEGADTEKASQEMIEKWEEETGNTVNQTNFTYDMLHEKILTAAAGGNVPDLIWGLPEYVGEFYNMGIVADLTDKFNEWEDKDALSDSVVNAMTIDNKIVGIPYEMTVRAYLVHDDDLKAAGIETPATWEDLLAQSDYYDNNGKYLTELACTGVRASQELLVYLAQERKEKGGSIEDVANWIETHKRNIVHLFTVDDLDHLYRGGRVSRTTAFLGGMLNIKPILHVDDAGKLIPIGKVRGRKKSLLELADLMDRKIGSYAKSCNMIFISHGDCREEAEFLARKIKQKYQITTELINDVGAVIGAHSGPGTMALFFVGDVR